MADSLVFALKRLINTWLMASIILGGLITWFWFGPGLESSWNPVLRDQTYRVSRDGADVTFDLRMYKARDCRLVDLDWVIQKGERTSWIRVFDEDGYPVGTDVTYPIGWRTLGPFHFTLPYSHRDADQVYGYLQYDCHPGWVTRQILGPVRIP